MKRAGVVKISDNVLRSWLKLPDGCEIVGIAQTTTDRQRGIFRVTMRGTGMPVIKNDDPPHSIILKYKRMGEETIPDYILSEIADHDLIYWPPPDEFGWCEDYK